MNLFLFDVDGTICESGKIITNDMATQLNLLMSNGHHVGIVGGGTFEKIMYQLNNKISPQYIFSECGSVYHILNNNFSYECINKNNLRSEESYPKINMLVKHCLKFISNISCNVSGNFIDLRNGLIYVSLVGMVATDDERKVFIEEDKICHYRNNLINELKTIASTINLNDVDICLGGSVGVAIYPKKWNKTQVLNFIEINMYDSIYYFGDKYELNGNDYDLLNHKLIVPHCVDNPDDTYNIITTQYHKN
jgi:phosphomannomutase